MGYIFDTLYLSLKVIALDKWIDIQLCGLTMTEYAQWLSGVGKIQQHVIFEILLDIQVKMSSRYKVIYMLLEIRGRILVSDVVY